MQTVGVRYVTTSDSYRIAYCVTGSGPLLVFMPFLFNHIGLPLSDVQSPLVQPLTKHFRVVRYDARGQGLSSRGLGKSLSVVDYERDLEALIGALPPEPVVLIGGAFSAHVAVRYATQHPAQVRALVLLRAAAHGEAVVGPHFSLDLAQSDWDFFVHAMVSATRAAEATSPEQRRAGVQRFKASMTQVDWLEFARTALTSNVETYLPLVQAPTLVFVEPDLEWPPPTTAARIASLMPNARLVTVSGHKSRAEMVRAILDFIAAVPVSLSADSIARESGAASASPRLTQRELQILRLLAAGRTNREISTELVLSVRTVARHIANIYDKIEARSRAEATAFAFTHGLVFSTAFVPSA